MIGFVVGILGALLGLAMGAAGALFGILMGLAGGFLGLAVPLLPFLLFIALVWWLVTPRPSSARPHC